MRANRNASWRYEGMQAQVDAPKRACSTEVGETLAKETRTQVTASGANKTIEETKEAARQNVAANLTWDQFCDKCARESRKITASGTGTYINKPTAAPTKMYEVAPMGVTPSLADDYPSMAECNPRLFDEIRAQDGATSAVVIDNTYRGIANSLTTRPGVRMY